MAQTPMSDTEDLQKTLTEAQAEVSQQLDIARELKNDPEAALKEREDAVRDSLAGAGSAHTSIQRIHVLDL